MQNPNIDSKTYVLRLQKSIYGLRQSPALWNSTLTTFFLSQGFAQNNVDDCIFTKTENGELREIVGVYVDDIIIGTYTDKEAQAVKQLLESKFDVADLGRAHFILGMRIVQTTNTISIDQAVYVESLLNKYGLSEVKTRKIPAIPNAKQTVWVEGNEKADI